MSQLGKLLDDLEAYDFADAAGKPLTDSKAFAGLRQMASDMDRVLATAPQTGAQALVTERATKDPAVPKPADEAQRKAKIIYTEVILPGVPDPQTVGWDTCGKCHMHVRICKCADGPTQPPSVMKWLAASGQDGSPRVGRYGQVEVVSNAEAAEALGVTEEAMAELVTEAEAGYDVADMKPIDTHVPGRRTGEVQREEMPTGVCTGCGIDVSPENGDQNDDGSWTCWVCQTQEGVTP